MCRQCPPGTFGLGLQKNETCKPCAGDNEFTSTYGNSVCSLCNENEYADVNHTRCSELITHGFFLG